MEYELVPNAEAPLEREPLSVSKDTVFRVARGNKRLSAAGCVLAAIAIAYKIYAFANLYDMEWFFLIWVTLVELAFSCVMFGAGDVFSSSKAAVTAYRVVALVWGIFTCIFVFNVFVFIWLWTLMMFTLVLGTALLLYWSCSCYSASDLTRLTRCGVGLVMSNLFTCILLLAMLSYGPERLTLATVMPLRPTRASTGRRLTSAWYDDWSTCRLDELDDEGCKLRNLRRGRVYNIYPGGDTQCLGGEEYYFQVIPGDSDKVLYYFNGGGACWNFALYWAGLCSASPSYMYQNETWTGIFDIKNSKNPYKDYTIIKLIFCSGDVYSGHRNHFWVVPRPGRPWKPGRGFAQQSAVLKWMISQFEGPSAGLKRLSSLTIAGSSAGSLATQILGGSILKRLEGHFNPAGTRLVGDSFLGVSPGGNFAPEEMLLGVWGVCESGALSKLQSEKCNRGELSLLDVFEQSMQDHPSTQFTSLQSKYDVLQIMFGNILSESYAISIVFPLLHRSTRQNLTFNKEAFYEQTNIMLRTLAKHDNYQAYLVDSADHVYLEFSTVYTSTPAGSKDECKTHNSGMLMIDYLAEKPSSKQWQCYQSRMNNATPAYSKEWCDHELPWVQLPCKRWFE